MATIQKTENKAYKYKFNAVDAFIIVLAMLCAIGIYFRSNIKSWVGIDKELKEYKITFTVESIKSTSDQYLAVGNEVYVSSTGLSIGTLSTCSSVPSTATVENELGEAIEVTYPENTYIDVTGTITCKGIEKEDGFYLKGSYVISPGTVISANTEMLDFSLTVISIEEISD